MIEVGFNLHFMFYSFILALLATISAFALTFILSLFLHWQTANRRDTQFNEQSARLHLLRELSGMFDYV